LAWKILPSPEELFLEVALVSVYHFDIVAQRMKIPDGAGVFEVKNEISLLLRLIRTAMVWGSRDSMKKVFKVCFSC
jgi:hypothetical protein